MKHILILGGGYGGLETALRLEKSLKNKAKVTLISKHDYHYQTTLLHRVALGTYSTRKARIFFRKILKTTNFIKDTILQIDPDKKQVKGMYGCYEYDYLVISLGFEPNDFGISGVKEYAFRLGSVNQAVDLLHSMEAKFKDYNFNSDPNDLRFVVVGSGFTGVEFAAELSDRAKELCEICGLDKNLIKIYLIGRSDQILPMFSPKLSQIAKTKLQKKGLNIIKANATECQKDGVIIEKDGKSEKIYANTILWSAGVKGNEVIKNSKFESKNSRIKVDENLRVPNYPEIFVIGDCAMASGRDIIHAPTAQLATQMGSYCAKALTWLINSKQIKKPFVFHHKGTVCSIGHTDAVGFAFGVGIIGEVAAFLKNFIENKWLYAIGGLVMVIKKGQFRFRSSD